MHKKWTREEHVLALNLYFQLPFGKINKGHKQVIELAGLLNRTPSSISMKLGNFGRLDPALKSRGVGGLKNGAKGEVDVWDEFRADPEAIAYESEELRARYTGVSVVEANKINPKELPKEGEEKERMVKTRVNQNVFRKRVLSAYSFQCCVTQIQLPSLLVAGHIVPWSEDSKNRLNPLNGICLNRLHDKIFEDGNMWIDHDYKIRFDEDFFEAVKENDWIVRSAGHKITTGATFVPDIEFLEKHALKYNRVF